MLGRRGYFPIVRQRVRPPQFRSLFLFVTSRCNSLCRTCFYFDKLNSRDDLSFDQIRRISETAPDFEKLWISGGEPFLRDELAQIVTLFARNNGVRNINLPTNGLLPARIFAATDGILENCPEASIDLNFSLDGLANTHDAIRGVPNNFVRTMATLREAEKRYGGIGRLRRNVVTVITRENYDEIVALGRYILTHAKADGHYFEVVRGQVPDPGLKNLTEESLKTLHRKLMPVHRRYADRLFGQLSAIPRAFATMYYLGNVRLHFHLHEKCFEAPKPWPMPCTAGATSMVVDHNGAFRACEMRDVVGNLGDFDFDVGAALGSAAMQREVAGIAHAGCWCTHSCFIQDSSKFSAGVQLFAVPWHYLRQRLEGGQEVAPEEMERFKSLEVA